MTKGRMFVIVITGLFLGWVIWTSIQTWRPATLWSPRISFYTPAFLYTQKPVAFPPPLMETDQPLPLPEPSSSLEMIKTDFVFSNTPLPKIDAPHALKDEKTAFKTYRKPYAIDPNKNQIALVISHLGLNKELTQEALSSLPEQVTLAFSANAADLENLLTVSRQQGFATLLNLPMETNDFPAYDPGEKAIYSFASNEQNEQVIDYILARNLPISGLIFQNTAPLEAHEDVATLLKKTAQEHGLVTLSTTALDIPLNRPIDLDIHLNLYPEAFEAYLAILKDKAQAQGNVVAVFPPVPIVMHMFSKWVQENTDPTIEFVPVSVLFDVKGEE